MKLPVAMMFKVTKIYTGPRKDRTNLWKWNSSSSTKYKDARLNELLHCKLQEADRAFERNITSMPASFLSLPKTSAADVTGPCGSLWPYEPLVWASTAVLVIASESVLQIHTLTPPTTGLETMDTRWDRGRHNPYIYLAPEQPRNTALQPWT